MPRRQRPSSESGFALMEVLASMAVLVMVVLGVLAAMDAVAGTAGANQARTIAAVLAEKDQERLRGLATREIETLDETRAMPVGKVRYSVRSQARWVSVTTDQEASCAMADGDGSFLRITSTVTSPATGAEVPPVVLTSLVAPQAGRGTLTAKVMTADGTPPAVPLNVQAVGPDSGSQPTNAAGCAVFGQRMAGSYQIVLDTPGWVNRDGVQRAVETATVSAGTLTTRELVYDEGVDVTAQVETSVGGVRRADLSTGVTAFHTGMSVSARVSPATAITTSNAGAASQPFAKLFPFTTPYAFYAGRCDEANPETYVPNYFTAEPAATANLGTVTGATSVKVLEPALDLTVTGSGASGLRVYAYPYPKPVSPQTVSECGPRIFMGTTQSNGKLLYPGLPFGTYDVCVESTNRSRKRVLPPQAITTPAGRAVTTTAPEIGTGLCGSGATP